MRSKSNFDNVYAILHKDDGRVQKDFFIDLFESDDPDILGLGYDFMTDKDRAKRIFPELSWEEAHFLVRKYYKECIKENFTSDWADSRFFATLDCMAWIDATWQGMDNHQKKQWALWVNEIKGIDEITFTRLSGHLTSKV